MIEFELGVTVLGARVHEGKIELLVRRAQLQKEVEDLVENLLGIRVLPVDLVDHDDRFGAGFQRLPQHETGLRLRAFRRVHHQQHAVDHAHRPLDLAPEVGVPRSVDNIDVVVLVLESGVLGPDRDPLLTFQVHRIHDPLLARNRLVGPERAGLLQKAIDQRRLSMVDVRNDSDVPDVLHIRTNPVNRAAQCAPPAVKVKHGETDSVENPRSFRLDF